MRWVLLAALTACGFSKSVPGPAGEKLTLVDDELTGGRVGDGIVESGTIVPDGFVLDGLHARAYTTNIVDTGETMTKVFADADAAQPTGIDYAQIPTSWNGGRPNRLGLTQNFNYSVVFDGEILLPKGAIMFELDADDRGIVEVLGQTLVNQTANTPIAMALTVPETGWYPIRAAISQDFGNSRLELTIIEGQIRTPVDGDRLRARVTAANGLLVYSFDKQGFVDERGHSWRPTIDEAFSVFAPPYDTTPSQDRFSLRFAGQLRIDTPGTYAFAAKYDGDDGWRLWIDGTLRAHHWLGHPDVSIGMVDLTAGWHAIVVDYADEIGNAEIRVTMTGPDAPAGGVIDTKHLRPVVVRGNTLTFANTQNPTVIADNQMTFVPLPLAGNQFTLIDSVDVGFRIDNQDMSTLTATLFDCNGPKQLAVNPAPSYHYFPDDKSCAGQTTNPLVDWQLRLTDSVIGNGLFLGPGQIRDYGVTALYRGGRKMPFAPLVTYVSAPRETPGAAMIESVTATGSFDGATVEVAIRTGADAGELEAAEFVVVRERIRYEASELAQYRVTISSNGWQYPVLDRVELVYSTP